MTFNTKLNIGDTIWHVSTRAGCVKQATITGITITYKPIQYYRGKYFAVIVYESNDNCYFVEENEGRYWWSTSKGIIDHLTKTLKSVGNEKKSDPVATPNPNIKPPIGYASWLTDNELPDDFDEFFKDKLPREHVKITLPPRIPTKVSLIKKTTKTAHHCGIHRKSELIRRMKPLPGIREKTLTDYANEL
jgi:hypothetical protein